MKYKAQAPCRVDFGGGWSDVPVFAESEPGGGAVLNAAIAIYVKGYIIHPGDSAAGILGRFAGEKSVFRYELDAPSGAGLGASAAQTLLWLTLVKTSIANVSERRELAERAWQVEGALGILGGKQDEYASAVGGINLMTFGDETKVEELRPGFPFTEDFERRLVLIYTGQKHLSSDIHEAVWGGYQRGEPRVVEGLRNLRRIAVDMREALMAHDLDTFGGLMNENWENQKSLHESITNPTVDRLVSVAGRSGAIGVKACGAGGGGCLICLAAEGGEERLAEAMTAAGGRRLPFKFDWYGVHLTKG
jgi:D-glycero-alpha-D-manno-heptose-7-phosphate kinase